MQKPYRNILFSLISFLIIVILTFVLARNKNSLTGTTNDTQSTPTSVPSVTPDTPVPSPTPTPIAKTSVITEPISNAKSRITKKPFGIYVSPSNSPVQPEKFTGYHTGVDFETTSSELTQNIDISAAKDGKILVKQWVSGYGGVIIQSTVINGENVTILYGHLNINENSSLVVGSSVKAGDRLAILGAAYSNDTNGERKHLHLGIHKGTNIDYLGYVQNKSDLSGWIDATTLL